MRISRLFSRRSAAALLATCVMVGPLTVGLAGAQDNEIESLREEREARQREAAEVAAQLDALAAEDADLAKAVETLDNYIALQEDLVSAAEKSILDAERIADEAQAEVAEMAAETERVIARLRVAAVNAFVDPDLDTLHHLDTGDLLTAEIKKTYVSDVVGDEVELIQELRRLRAASDAAVERAHDATAEAEAERTDLAARLDDLATARDDVAELRAQVAIRIGEWQTVGDVIEAADNAIEEQIRALEAERAAEAERIRLEEEEARRIAEEEAAQAEDPADPEPPTEPEEPGDANDETVPSDATFAITHRPVPGVITSPFGSRVHPIFGTTRNHYGVDFDASRGEPISAAASGTVLTAGWMNGYGNTVVISHGNGYTTLYAHQTSVAVTAGDTIAGGDLVGYAGDTGWATGPHLHFEVRIDGIAVDPAGYL